MKPIFEASAPFHLQDQTPFSFRHNLVDHPSLRIEKLAETIPELEKRFVFHSARKMSKGEDFEQALTENREVESIESAIANIRQSDAYIMVREPERHAAFSGIHRQLTAEIEHQVSQRGWGRSLIEPRAYLFISSPDSITPFHYDRASNFLLQIRGAKEVTVFPPWHEKVITSHEYESHMAYQEASVKWKPESEHLGRKFTCSAGDALHIPFVAGHHVRNGSGDLSITLSIFFNHRRSWAQLKALRWNNKLRSRLSRLGLKPVSVGRNTALDHLKSLAYRAHQRFTR